MGLSYSLSYWTLPDCALCKVVAATDFLFSRVTEILEKKKKKWMFPWSLLWTRKRTNLTWGSHFSGRGWTSRLYAKMGTAASCPAGAVSAAECQGCVLWGLHEPKQPSQPAENPWAISSGWLGTRDGPEKRGAGSKFPPTFSSETLSFCRGRCCFQTLMMQLKTKYHNPRISG